MKKRNQKGCCRETSYEIRITGPELDIAKLLKRAFGIGKRFRKKKHRKK